MQRTAAMMTRALLAVVGLAITGRLALPPAAEAQVRSRPRREPPASLTRMDSDDWQRWDDFNWTILQMQRESIASQEEMSREAGRSVRREEVEQEREASATEHQAYFDSLLEASRAALRAPQGGHYRKPGWVSAEQPGAESRTVTVGGISYLFDRGVFWLPQGLQNIVVTAPFGAVVDSLPMGSYPVPSGSEVLHYYFGTFYRQRVDGFEVVKPPAGVVVSYLPDGYVAEQANNATFLKYGQIVFKPVFIQGILLYQVTEP